MTMNFQRASSRVLRDVCALQEAPPQHPSSGVIVQIPHGLPVHPRDEVTDRQDVHPAARTPLG